MEGRRFFLHPFFFIFASFYLSVKPRFWMKMYEKTLAKAKKINLFIFLSIRQEDFEKHLEIREISILITVCITTIKIYRLRLQTYK